MVSVTERLIFVNLLNEKGKYEIQKPFAEGDTLAPRDFPELKVELITLFENLPEEL